MIQYSNNFQAILYSFQGHRQPTSYLNSNRLFHKTFHAGTLPPVNMTVVRRTANRITVNIGTIPDGIDRVIIGYHRLDLGQPVVGQYVNNNKGSSRTFYSLEPGTKYMITAWGLGGGSYRRRSSSPAVVEVTTDQESESMYGMLLFAQYSHGDASQNQHYLICITVPSPPRELTITRVFQDGIELNWIPPNDANGNADKYIITYNENDTRAVFEVLVQTSYYFNLTGLEKGKTYYNIEVFSKNEAGINDEGLALLNSKYCHLPRGQDTHTVHFMGTSLMQTL